MTEIMRTQQLVERLRYRAAHRRTPILTAGLLTEAYDELTRLAATVETMREALELFIGQAVFDPHTHRASVDEFVVSKARAALSREVGQSTGQGVGRG